MQKRKFVRLEFLLFRDSIKICASLFVLYDKYNVLYKYVNQIRIFNSTNIRQLEVRTSNESDWQVRLLSSKYLLHTPESQPQSNSGRSFV